MFTNKKWMCMFIALVILISGIWVDEVKADSAFLCPKINTVSVFNELPAMYSNREVLSEAAVESIQILCTCSAINSRQIMVQIINNKRVIKLSMFFLCAAIFTLVLSNFYSAERVTEYPKHCMWTAVLNYIHNADGKK